MKQINNYIQEKLFVGRGFNTNVAINPLNVIRNTFIDHAKEWWGDANGFKKEEIHVEAADKENNVISAWAERTLTISQLKQVASEICEYLEILEMPYKSSISIESGSKKILIFTKKV